MAAQTDAESACTDALSVAEYRRFLADRKVVYTPRTLPSWSEGLRTKLSEEAPPLQVWLINEPLELLSPRLIQGLSLYGLAENLVDAVTQDVLSLVGFFVELSGELRPFVSLRTIDDRYFAGQERSVSRDWHVDTAVLTLSCTYAGRGTQWIEGHDQDRARFAKEKMPRSLQLDVRDDEVREMVPFEVSVLKGEIRDPEDAHSLEFLRNFLSDEELRPFNAGGGLLHRGPGYREGEGRRLLLTVSTMRIPGWLDTSV